MKIAVANAERSEPQEPLGKPKDGVYTMMLTTKTEDTVTDSEGNVSFFYMGVTLPVYGGQKNGTFYGTLTLES